jgi:hypothetical protein
MPFTNIFRALEVKPIMQNPVPKDCRRKLPKRPTTPLGYLDYVPDEIQFHILSYLTGMDLKFFTANFIFNENFLYIIFLFTEKSLANLGCCSKVASDLVTDYLNTFPFMQKIVRYVNTGNLFVLESEV